MSVVYVTKLKVSNNDRMWYGIHFEEYIHFSSPYSTCPMAFSLPM